MVLTDPQRRALVDAAVEARREAFAPYSGFSVGAAVITSDGRTFGGCNVEVSSYSHSCCAERVAVFKAVSEGARQIVACAVVTDTSPPVGPCGACRQVLSDFGRSTVLLLANLDDEVREVRLAELLPEAFRPDEVLEHIKKAHRDR